jgi:glycosyltransferase involved in cell wall biosynthesis
LQANKRIALITTWFPPQESVATNRMLAFAEFLSETFEVEVFCLAQEEKTIEWNNNIRVHYSASSEVLERLKDKTTDGAFLHKVKVATRIILSKVIPNPLVKWQKSTLSKLKQIHSQNAFDCIISSYSPQEAHLVAIDFKKEFSTVPWIADMRDEMAANPYLDTQTKNRLLAIEKEVNEYADALTSVSEPILLDFQKSMSKIAVFEEIRNGFNHQFKRNLNSEQRNDVFTLGYFGTFYGKRKPTILLEALKQLKLENKDFDFRFEIIGAHQNFTIPTEIASKIHLLPPLTYADAIEKMATMDANIQIHPRSEQKGIFTGKLFDYISVQKSVIALVDTEDVAAKLIQDFDCGYVAEFSEIEANKKVILEAFNDWKMNQLKFAKFEQVQTLHRRNQVMKLMELITNLTQ